MEGVLRVMDKISQPNLAWIGDHPDCGASAAPCPIYNIGNSDLVDLMTVIHILESKLDKKARMNLLRPQPGDVPSSCADVEDLVRDVDFKPETSIEKGITRFVDWYREHYRR